jgi:opacity protein-like surface antigen
MSDNKTTARWITIGLFSLSMQAALATSQPASTVFTLSGGAAWEHAGQTQTFYLAPGIEKTYTANKSTHTLAEGEVFLGKQLSLYQHILGQFGVAFAAANNAKLSGNIWDDANPQFNNFTYQYKIEHTHVAAKGKLLGDWGYKIEPWISASLGIGLNRANGFTSSPTIYEAIATPNFNSNNQIAFTYTLGVGIQTALTTNWQAGIGYEFADWGKSQLDAAPGQTQGNGLSLNHLYTNSAIISLTYLS